MQINIDTAQERAKIESEISSLQNRLELIGEQTMTDKPYTPENCKLVGELVDIAVSDPIAFFKYAHMAPELIREALAKEGVSVLQGYRHRNGYLDLAWKCSGERIYLRQPWSFRNDPTARHALFAATVEYLEGKK